MKTKNWLYLITVICFSILFYRQEAGINFVLFAGLLLLASGLLTKTLWKTKQWLIIAAGVFISSFFVMYYANGLTIVMSIISLLILLILQKSKSSSYLVALFSGILSIFGFLIFIILGNINARRLKQLQKNQQNNRVRRWQTVLIVAIVSFLFLSLYRSINPIFDSYFSVFFGNITWGWIFFTLFGTIILYPFFYPPRFLRKVLTPEYKYGAAITEASLRTNIQTNFGLFSSFENERHSALLMFAVLNLLLLFLNITDIHYLFLEGQLPVGITYSDYVHSGVGAVILSIIMAIALITFYFRGHINFDAKSKPVKILTYSWIVQNITLVVMALFKNQLYIDAYSLTYKRIGVYYYLSLAILGLLLTLYKIIYRKDTWFLFRSNSFGIYVVLVLSCAFNWNTIVTRYNLKNSRQVDYPYLSNLGYQNYPLLWEDKFYDLHSKQEFELQLTGDKKNYYLPFKIGKFLQNYENTGVQSYCIARKKTYRYFLQQAKANQLVIIKDELKENDPSSTK